MAGCGCGGGTSCSCPAGVTFPPNASLGPIPGAVPGTQRPRRSPLPQSGTPANGRDVSPFESLFRRFQDGRPRGVAASREPAGVPAHPGRVRASGSPLGVPPPSPCGVGATHRRISRAGGPLLASPPGRLGDVALFPGFSLTVPRDGNWAPTQDEAARQVAAAGRDVVRPGVGTGQVLTPGAAVNQGPAGVTLAAMSPAAGTGPGVGGGNPFCRTKFTYRDQSFTVPCEFYTQHLLDEAALIGTDEDTAFGTCSSVNQTLDLLWLTFRTEVRTAHTSFESLLGCFNLPRNPDPGGTFSNLFWSMESGAALQVHLFTCQLLRTYVADTEYRVEGDPCQGYPDFLRDLLDGREATTQSGKDTCSLTVHYRNSDPEFASEVNTCTKDVACTDGFNPDVDNVFEQLGDLFRGEEWDQACPGPNFDEWTPTWVPDLNCYSDGTRSDCDRPNSLCDNLAIGGEFGVTFHPIQLAYDGLVADRIMSMARLCLDYGLSIFSFGDALDAFEYLETAQRIARYALRIIADRAAVLAREVGHSYLGTGHCTHDCCFDTAAQSFLCRTRAHLGLPRNTFEPRPTGDYDNPDALIVDECGNCSTDDGRTSHLSYYCDTVLEGQLKSVAAFYSFGCLERNYDAATAREICADPPAEKSGKSDPIDTTHRVVDLEAPDRETPTGGAG